jgi:hypothetical protein
MVGRLENNRLETMREEAVVTYLKADDSFNVEGLRTAALLAGTRKRNPHNTKAMITTLCMKEGIEPAELCAGDVTSAVEGEEQCLLERDRMCLCECVWSWNRSEVTRGHHLAL